MSSEKTSPPLPHMLAYASRYLPDMAEQLPAANAAAASRALSASKTPPSAVRFLRKVTAYSSAAQACQSQQTAASNAHGTL